MLSRRHLLTLIALLPAAAAYGQIATFSSSQLTIVSKSGRHKFYVEVAMTPEQMMQGLMFRRTLAPNAGMLFIYQQPEMAEMWMKNTLIPLDMLFVDAEGKIVNIHQRAVPGSLELIGSAAPVRAVIELNGGTTARLGIKPGDRILYPIFEHPS